MEKADEKVSILIVDDDEGICKSLALILRKKGYAVETAGTGHEALEKVQEGFFNIALLDIKLPDMEGIELISPLKELHPDIDMFMITAYASMETAVEALNKGATAYFLKPPDMDEVLVSVKDALEKQRLVRENRMLLKAVQKELAERKQAEEALIKAHDELEQRVVERTNELAEINVKLQDDITKRKQAEVALRTSEEKYRLLSENAIDGIYILGPNGFKYVNPAFEQTSGYKAEEILQEGFDWRELVHPDDKPLIVDRIKRREKGEELSPTYEFRLIRKDGKVRFVEVNTALLPGEPWRVFGIYRDVTERKQMEEALRESEEKYRTIVENVSDQLVYINKSGTIISANDKEAIWGRKPEEIIGKKFTELGYFNVKDIPKYLKLFKNVITGKKTINLMEIEIKHKDGHKIPVEVNTSLVKKNGKIEGCLCVVRDITERTRAENALRESEERYRKLFEEARDGIFLANAETGVIVDYNRAAAELVGRDISELIGQHQKILHPPHKVKGRFTESFKKHLEDSEGQVLEEQVITSSGEIKEVAIKANLLNVGGRKLLQGMFRDITERKWAEKALKESEEHYRELVEKAGIAIVIDDQEGKFDYFNDQFLKIFGYSPNEIKQHSIQSFVHPDDVEMVASYHQARLQGKEAPTRYEFRGIKKDGTTVFLEVDVVCLREGKSIIGTRSYFWDITERKGAEEALMDSEAKHRNILESIEEGYFEVDLAGNLTFFNDSLCRMVGFSRSELMGMNNREYTSPETAKKMYEAFNEMHRTGKPLKLTDYKVIRADGNTRDFEMSASLMRDPSGEPIGFRGVVRDTTERKQAEKEREKLLYDMRERIKELNCMYEVATSIRKREALEEIFRDVAVLIPPSWQYPEITCARLLFDEAEYITEPFEKTEWKQSSDIIVGGESRGTVEVYHLESRPEEDEGQFLKEERQLLDGIASALGEAIERKQAEEALWSSQEYAQNIVDSSLDMIIAVDNQRRITAFNAAAVETFGYESEEVLGKHVNLLYADPKEGLRVHKKTVKHGHHIQEILNRRKDGVLFPCLLSASVLRNAHGNRVGVMGVSRDITERKQTEDKLRHYASELERSNKELQQFAHAISHDLQEPLRTIRSYLQLLADRYQLQLDADADTFIAYAVDGANRMREQIRGILALSKVDSESKKLEPIDCEHVLESILTGLQTTIKVTHAQITHDRLPTVMADRTQMGQSFQNLIENAIKFKREEPPCVHISAREEGANWLFSVRDNGIGIDPEQTERIFEIFRRLAPQNKYPGTGIGLSICKKIVERHGGKIWVESTPGEGSTFYFTIEK